MVLTRLKLKEYGLLIDSTPHAEESLRRKKKDSGLTFKTKLPSISEKEVRLIVGTNAPEAFWVLEERRGNRGEPYAIRTPLGWTLMGPVGGIDCRERHLNVNFVRLV